MSEKPVKPRGFATLSPERRKEIASLGGRAVPAESRAFSRDATLAAEAGRKGGQAVDGEHRTYFLDRELASRCGKRSAESNRVARAEEFSKLASANQADRAAAELAAIELAAAEFAAAEATTPART